MKTSKRSKTQGQDQISVSHYEFGDRALKWELIYSHIYAFMLGKESPTTEDEGGRVIIVFNTVIVATVVLYVGDSHAYS